VGMLREMDDELKISMQQTCRLLNFAVLIAVGAHYSAVGK